MFTGVCLSTGGGGAWSGGLGRGSAWWRYNKKFKDNLWALCLGVYIIFDADTSIFEQIIFIQNKIIIGEGISVYD